jgi:hypothetical protein
MLSFLLGGASIGVRAAGSATDITGLYYTGLNGSGGLQTGGGRDANWDVTYARVNGTTYSGSSGYTSSAGAYVLSSAQWITAPGAMTAATGGSANLGGDYLPGNGTTGTNSAFYVYQLAFEIAGTYSGGGPNARVVSNDISISLTIAADDAYEIYVTRNQVTVDGSGNINAQYAASASGTSAWDNTTAVVLQNFGSGAADNTTFNIGTNYLTIVVRNTNSQTGTNSSTALNPSGLLVYQVGALATIDGRVIPEVGTTLPLLCAAGLYGAFAWRRERFRREARGPGPVV